jgi:hypothetical protein
MQATNWIDNIADESNLWLSAVKAEEGGELDAAVVLYLKDASACLASETPLKAALSCSSAASCMLRLGSRDRARQLYVESAQIYLDRARSVAGVSVREFLWCLRESYRAFQHGGMREKAEGLRGYYLSLAGRVDPFVFADAIDASDVAQPDKEGDAGDFEEAPLMTQEIERFLKPRKDAYRKMGTPGVSNAATPKRRAPNYETSIINQLG